MLPSRPRWSGSQKTTKIASGRHLGASWARLGAYTRSVLGRLGTFRGRLGAVLERLSGIFGRIGFPLGGSLECLLGGILGSLGMFRVIL